MKKKIVKMKLNKKAILYNHMTRYSKKYIKRDAFSHRFHLRGPYRTADISK